MTVAVDPPAGGDGRMESGSGKVAGRVVVPLVLVPAVLLAVAIERYSVNFPFWDNWELVPILAKHHTGDLGFTDLWTQHNEHRIVVPKALMLVLAVSSKWNIRYELLASFIVAAVICLLVLWTLRRTILDLSPLAYVVLAVAGGWIVFSTSQWENWLWGWQLQWYLNVLGMVVAAWALAGGGTFRRPGIRVAIAIGGAVLGMFSLASGVLIWLAALPALLARRELRRYVVVWCLAGVAATVVYLAGYRSPTKHPPLSAFFEHPWSSARYVLTYVGMPATPSLRWAPMVGAALFVVTVAGIAYLARGRGRAMWAAAAPWVALALYGLLTSGATALGRVGFVGRPPAPRYVTISMLFLLAGLVVAALVLNALPRHRAGTLIVRVTAVPLAGLLALGLTLTYLQGWKEMRHRHEAFVRMRGCLLSATSESDPCLADLYPDSSVLWERANVLRRWGWGGFPQRTPQ
jgi:hypothetical protein